MPIGAAGYHQASRFVKLEVAVIGVQDALSEWTGSSAQILCND